MQIGIVSSACRLSRLLADFQRSEVGAFRAHLHGAESEAFNPGDTIQRRRQCAGLSDVWKGLSLKPWMLGLRGAMAHDEARDRNGSQILQPRFHRVEGEEGFTIL